MKSEDVCGWEAERALGVHAAGVRSPVTRACTAMFMRGFSETVCDGEHRGGRGRRGPQSAAISAASALTSASTVRQAGAASLSERDHWVEVRK